MRNRSVLVGTLVFSVLATVVTWVSLQPQAESRPKSNKDSHPLARLNDKAKSVRRGDASADNLTAGIFELFEVSDLPAPITGQMKQRISRAETSYREGRGKPVLEQSVVKAINGIADEFGLPDYTKVDPYMVRRARVSLMTRIPALMAPEDTRGDVARGRAGGPSMNAKMSPLEASLVAFYLVQQKLMNESYQVTPREWRANVQAKLLERWQQRRGIKLAPVADEGSPTELAPTKESARSVEIKRLAGKRAASMNANDVAKLCDSFLDTLGIDR